MVEKEQPPVKRPVPLPAATGRHTGVVLYKIAQFLQEQLDTALQPWGIKTRHYSVLGILAHMQPLSQQGLAEKLRIDPAMIVAIVDDLERLGVVARNRNTRDRRLYDITLTDGAYAVLREAEAALTAMEDAFFAPLTGAERRQLHALLTRLFAPLA